MEKNKSNNNSEMVTGETQHVWLPHVPTAESELTPADTTMRAQIPAGKRRASTIRRTASMEELRASGLLKTTDPEHRPYS